MEERAQRIELGEYSPQELMQWFAEMGEAGEFPEDDIPLLKSNSLGGGGSGEATISNSSSSSSLAEDPESRPTDTPLCVN